MSAIVYKYGLLPPTESADVIADQLRMAHRYRNTLVEIERGRRAAVRAALGAAMLECETLEAEFCRADNAVVEAVRAVSAKRATTRSRSEQASDREAVKAAKARRKVVKDALRAARRAAFEVPEARAAIDEINARANELQRNARYYSGLARGGPYNGAFGTYQLVEDAAFAASTATPMFDGAEPNDPKFVHAGHTTHVSVQITDGGVSVDRVMSGGHGYVAITTGPRPNCNHRNHRPEDCRPQPYLRLRLSNGGGRNKPDVWGSWPIVLHRPLPANGIIKRVTATATRVGPRTVWTAEFTVEIANAIAESCGKGTVAIDLGWTRIGNRLRVAAWCDERGNADELCIDARLLARFAKVDDLRSIRDANFSTARDALAAWLHERDVPEWLANSTRTLDQWKSPARLAGLAARWARNRFDGDAEVFGRPPTRAEIAEGVRGPGLAGWAAQDRHLWEWESNQRRAILFERREVYRQFAVAMTRSYGHILLPDVDYSAVAKRRPVEANHATNETADRNRMIAAVGDLRLIIEQAAVKRGAKAERVATQTGQCPSCGNVERAHVLNENRSFACISCGFVADRDKAQTLVMLREAGKGSKVDGIIKRARAVVRALFEGSDAHG